jgi:hypothetical protein
MEATRKACLLMTHEHIMLNITCKRAARNTASTRLRLELRSCKSQREAKQLYSGSLCRIIINYITCQSDQCRSRRLPESGVRAAFRENVVTTTCVVRGNVKRSLLARALQLPGKHRINILANNKHSLTYVGFLMPIPGSSVKRSGDITVRLN